MEKYLSYVTTIFKEWFSAEHIGPRGPLKLAEWPTPEE